MLLSPFLVDLIFVGIAFVFGLIYELIAGGPSVPIRYQRLR
ncbi:MAG TPA: hypothetical protein VME66_13575 [Candidatus Acidoferrales bacterium]|nr:hypothetical protein [Candidatus Acidoferrales bacterium]